MRNQTQFFDSNANYLNTPRDAYIDLIDFLERVEQADLTFDINNAAQAILSELGRPDSVILWERNSKIANLPKRYSCKPTDFATCQLKQIDMQRSHGISLYYPAEGKDFLLLPDENSVQPNNLSRVAAADLTSTTELTYTEVYSKYINNQLFDFTYDTRWDEFLVAAYGIPPVDASLATPHPPLPPVDPATVTPTPTMPPPPSTTGTPTPTPTATSTPSPTPMATATATATSTASATLPSTPTATLTPQPTVDAKKIQVIQSAQQSNQTLTIETTITNHGAYTLPNVVLVQTFNQPITTTLYSAHVVCQPNGDTEVRCLLGEIAPSTTVAVTFTVQFSLSTPISSQGQLWVNHQPFGDKITPIVQDERVFLPVIVR